MRNSVLGIKNSLKKGIETVIKANDPRIFRLKALEIYRSTLFPHEGGHETCRGGVNPEYIKDTALPKADMLILAYDVHDGNIRGMLRGFGIVQFYSEWMYLDVICRGNMNRTMKYRGTPVAAPGKAIIDEVLRYARVANLKGVMLSALQPVVKFYEHLGFKITARDFEQGNDPCIKRRRGPNRQASRTAKAPHSLYKGNVNLADKKKMIKMIQNANGLIMSRCL